MDLRAAPLLQCPAEKLMGVKPLEASPSQTLCVQTFLPRAEAWSLGWAGVLVDSGSGRSIALDVPAGTACLSTSMHIELVRPPIDVIDRSQVGVGRPLHIGQGWALGDIVIESTYPGTLVRATTRYLVIEPEPGTEPSPPPTLKDVSTPDHAADLLSMLALQLELAGEDSSRLSYSPQHRHANFRGSVHGGLQVAMVDAAIMAATSRTPHDLTWSLLVLDLSFHCPVPLISEPVFVEAETVHMGRHTAVLAARIRDRAGKVFTTARGHLGRVCKENGQQDRAELKRLPLSGVRASNTNPDPRRRMPPYRRTCTTGTD